MEPATCSTIRGKIMECTTLEHILDIVHNLSVVAVLVATFYFGSRQVNKKDIKKTEDSLS